ncbi:T9SS type A sorting domain-containing protein [Sabulibacter ruber]|uniref:T9SS type A sorting domain-containing protein n=1 Tax=Sabulibacter ruber TaxID=2811901 RepID=UPI001A970524|nr:T9SS type A sorting domain-containing protein [Sabulibacter ruber]
MRTFQPATCTFPIYQQFTQGANRIVLHLTFLFLISVLVSSSAFGQTITLDCERTSQDFDITYVNFSKNSNNTVTLTFTLQTNGNRALSHVAFELPAGAKATNPKHTNTKFSYSTENGTNTPFYALKFEAINAEGFKNGVSESFSYTLSWAEFSKMTTIRVEAKASTTVGLVSFKAQSCQPEVLVINGPSMIELNSTAVYTVPATGDNTFAYEWSAPAGWEIIKGQGTNMVTVKPNRKGGFMTVKKGNQSAGMLAVESYELSPITLPVSLTSFEAKVKTTGQVQLTWATASEKDNKEFVVERSTDGKNFTPVQSVAGAGNSNVLLNYTFQDAQPVGGVSYYRLKQVDYDGTTEYSKVVAVKNQSAAAKTTLKTTAFPNPFQGMVSLQVTQAQAAEIRVNLVDLAGNVLQTKAVQGQLGEQTISLENLQNMPAGIYFLRVYQGNEVSVHKLVKNS